MKKFLKYIGLFSLPLVLLCVMLEFSLRWVRNPFTFKRYLLEEKGVRIKNMIIGSSVADYGIDPAICPIVHTIWLSPGNGFVIIRLNWRDI